MMPHKANSPAPARILTDKVLIAVSSYLEKACPFAIF
jgi:hypothetical protein